MYTPFALLRRARKVLPQSACITLYNTMVVPLFDYSAVVWESCGQGSKSYLDKLNRRAACIIEARADKSGELSTSLRSKRFQSSYCAKVRAEAFFFALVPAF